MVDTGIPEWLTGMVIANVVAWSVLLGMVRVLLNRAKHTEIKTDQFVKKHDRLILNLQKAEEERARSGRELVHYMRWMVEKMTGQKPDPFVDTHI